MCFRTYCFSCKAGLLFCVLLVLWAHYLFPLVDSSSIQSRDWTQITQKISKHFENRGSNSIWMTAKFALRNSGGEEQSYIVYHYIALTSFKNQGPCGKTIVHHWSVSREKQGESRACNLTEPRIQGFQ